jgi:thiazole synthase/sulfur carrier protein
MEITFNGAARALPHSITIQELLDQLHLDCRQVVVEHNRSIVARQRLADIFLQPGDTLEVVHFVGGG